MISNSNVFIVELVGTVSSACLNKYSEQKLYFNFRYLPCFKGMDCIKVTTIAVLLFIFVHGIDAGMFIYRF